MKIALVGGVYGKDGKPSRRDCLTPEILLQEGLNAQGHEVASFSHYSRFNSVDFDIVHVHHLSYGAVRMASDSSLTPFVYTSHDGNAMAGLNRGLLRRAAARAVMARADAVVALSTTESQFQQNTFRLSGALHVVIPTAVAPLYRYERSNARSTEHPWQLLYVGQLIALKRVDVLLRAIQITSRQADVQLSLVYHNSELECACREVTRILGLDGRVHFLGSKRTQELAQIYQRADLFILPSAAEALPSVVTEAMTCGTPIIATDVGGVREQLGGYGLCIPPGGPEELAAAILRVLANYTDFQRESEAASQYALEYFSLRKMVDRHVALYSKLVGRKTAPRRRRRFRLAVDPLLRVGLSALCATK